MTVGAGPAKRECSYSSPSPLEPPLKKPLAAAAVALAAVATLAVPAGASTRTTWTHQALPCATGSKSATLVEKWQGDTVVKSWFNNPCAHQWLLLGWCQPGSQSDCFAIDVAPHHKGALRQGVYPTLHTGASCDDSGTTSYSYIPASKAPSCPND